MPQKLTKQYIIDEYKKCYQFTSYFVNTYCYIQHPTDGKIKFNLWDFQEDVIEKFDCNKKTIVLKSRQLGLSTVCASHILKTILFFDNKNVLIVATKQSVARNLFIKVGFMYDNLPSWLRGESPDEYNKLSLRLKNGSQVKAIASSDEMGRSEALSCLVIDEMAFIENIETRWSALQQTVAAGGQIIALSTPNGPQGKFFDLYTDAQAGSNSFYPIRLKWDVHPDHDDVWRAQQDKELGPRLAAQECDCDFISSGNTVIEPEILQIYETACKFPILKSGNQDKFWVWKEPEYNHDYIIAVDTSRGDAGDSSGIQVIDSNTMEQVAEFQDKLPPETLGQVSIDVAVKYNNGLLVIENTGIGYSTLVTPLNQNYPHLYYTPRNEIDMMPATLQSNMNKLQKFINNPLEFGVPGFSTSGKSRPLIINNMIKLMRENLVILNSVRLFNEFRTFIWKNGKQIAKSGKHDDLILPLAFGLWVRDLSLGLSTQNTEMTKELISGITSGKSQYPNMTSSFANYQLSGIKKNQFGSIYKEEEDYSWLL